MNTPYVFPRTLRVLSPAARCASPADMIRAWRRLGQLLNDDSGGRPMQAAAESYFSSMLPARSVWITGSGKEALFRVFKAYKSISHYRMIGMSAYTCPDVAAAAAAAGFDVLPLEVSEKTLEIDPEKLAEADHRNLAGVVLSNLYGLPDRLEPWLEIQSRRSLLIIDDACQALASRRGDVRVGTAEGTVGIASFGRGKALSGLGGGAIVVPPQGSGLGEEFEELLGRTAGKSPRLQAEPGSLFRETVYCLIQWVFGSPYGYRLPSSLPFLGLGKTECDLEVSIRRLSSPAIIQAISQLHMLERSAEHYVAAARAWHQALPDAGVQELFIKRGFSFFDGVVPIRYPVLAADGPRRDAVLERLLQCGLGATGSYPVPLQAYPELRHTLQQRPTPYAESIARRMLTLPVHRYVRAVDIERTVQLLREA